MDEKGYNVDNANDQWEGKFGDTELTGKVVEKIDKTKLQYVTRADCKHEELIRKPADDFDEGIIEVSCASCPLGFFERRAES